MKFKKMVSLLAFTSIILATGCGTNQSAQSTAPTVSAQQASAVQTQTKDTKQNIQVEQEIIDFSNKPYNASILLSTVSSLPEVKKYLSDDKTNKLYVDEDDSTVVVYGAKADDQNAYDTNVIYKLDKSTMKLYKSQS